MRPRYILGLKYRLYVLNNNNNEWKTMNDIPQTAEDGNKTYQHKNKRNKKNWYKTLKTILIRSFKGSTVFFKSMRVDIKTNTLEVCVASDIAEDAIYNYVKRLYFPIYDQKNPDEYRPEWTVKKVNGTHYVRNNITKTSCIDFTFQGMIKLEKRENRMSHVITLATRAQDDHKDSTLPSHKIFGSIWKMQTPSDFFNTDSSGSTDLIHWVNDANVHNRIKDILHNISKQVGHDFFYISLNYLTGSIHIRYFPSSDKQDDENLKQILEEASGEDHEISGQSMRIALHAFHKK